MMRDFTEGRCGPLEDCNAFVDAMIVVAGAFFEIATRPPEHDRAPESELV